MKSARPGPANACGHSVSLTGEDCPAACFIVGGGAFSHGGADVG